MKRNILTLLLLLVLAVALAACGGDKSDEGTSAPTTEPTAVPSAPTTEPTAVPPAPTKEPSEPTMPEYVTWSEYVPGIIELWERDTDDLPKGRKYRAQYYCMVYEYKKILSDEQRNDWDAYYDGLMEMTNYGKTQEEMLLVTMIKRYNIPRETVQEAINSYVEIGEKLGYDFWCEEYEIPNLDIIYTFDNDIINHYYRYE